MTLMISKGLALPPGFVYLDKIDSSIIQSQRYNSNDNFVGQPIDGYKSGRVVLTVKASKAQDLLKQKGYIIVVYDGYRPQTAVNNFLAWRKNSQDVKMKADYYPRVDKAKVFELGYVAKQSGHSRGSTVDMSIIPADQNLHTIKRQKRLLSDGFEILFLDDGTIDMGSSFDLFDKASHQTNDLISPKHQELRNFLKEIMENCGFENYEEEWWHFTLKNEPFPETYFDFKE